jgi:hypothetical protein
MIAQLEKWRGSIPGAGVVMFLFTITCRTPLGSLTSYPVTTEDLFQGSKVAGAQS